MFQIGFLEILIIFVIGLIVIGPNKLPDLVKKVIKLYKKLEIKFNNFKSDFEADIRSEELKKDVFNELRMEELDQNNQSTDEWKFYMLSMQSGVEG